MNYRTTLAELVEYLLRIPLQDYIGGTVTSSATATTTLLDTSRTEADDYFQNTTPVSRVHITSTTDGMAPIGEDREASDFGSNTVTITPAFSAVTTAGDKYIILKEYTWGELKSAINMAIHAISSRSLIDKIDETLEFQDDTYEYTIPPGFTHIYRISQDDGNGDYPDPIPPDQYKIIRYPIPRIHFYRFSTERQDKDIYWSEMWIESMMVDGRKMRIEGFGSQPELESEHDICYINPDYIVYQAATFLLGARMRPSHYAYQDIKSQYAVCQALANQFKADAHIQLPPNTKAV